MDSPITRTPAEDRGDLFAAACSSRQVLKHLSSRWGLLTLRALLEGPRRYSDLRRKLQGVSERMLAQTLRELEADGLLTRRSWPEVPPRVEYALTPLGHEAAEKLRLLAEWVEENLPRFQPQAAPEV
ncbi:helix-turn-helix domain-containing protein [Neomegalonema sp.]|uniref:winged helix-turn-helix transcriptional regulator n=1 Tax=Neomegalonema sp. TaxID=2039713 RepID=UPI00261D1357|nr:helix-turn-helix domain-containing protein [Neomegalonema sp.]MDD2868745.1 helix-turn-helix domain-containing protein [Neomegalonema sp.]